MAIKDDDLLYVQRPSGPDAGSYNTTVGNLLENGNYLSLDAAAPAQTIESTERVTFNGSPEFTKGLSVRSKADDFASIAQTSDLYPMIWSNGKGSLKIRSRGDLTNGVQSTEFAIQDSTSGTGVTVYVDTQDSPTFQTSLGTRVEIFGTPHQTVNRIFATSSIESAVVFNGATSDPVKGNLVGIQSTGELINNSTVGFTKFLAGADRNPEAGSTVYSLIDFESTAVASDAPEAFAFYTNGDAPSFHKGDFHIGGTSARSDFQVWKESLTFEQQLAYDGGELVAPAGLSSELTRDLGDDTNIILTADGDIIAKNFRIDLLQELV